jgi:carbon-monoxide dehydrogenase small subunit
MLGDYVRDHLHLTGTHLGCEHGVCGACTVNIDGQVARSCITLAHACSGASVTTIEGFDDDDCMEQLRSALTEEHGLQCGYCTPGVLIAARDLVLRLPNADERKVRLEMSGNLCRCTGYMGIVRAILRVLAERREAGLTITPIARAPLGPAGAYSVAAAGARAADNAGGTLTSQAVNASASRHAAATSRIGVKSGPLIHIEQEFSVDFAPSLVMEGLNRLDQVAYCLPGLKLKGPPRGQELQIIMQVRLGPILAEFDGVADVSQDPSTQSGRIQGYAVDGRSGTRAFGDIRYRLWPEANGESTRIALDLGYSLAGPLAQFSRGSIARDIARKLTDAFANNLRQQLGGGSVTAVHSASEINALGLIWSVVLGRLKALLGIRRS